MCGIVGIFRLVNDDQVFERNLQNKIANLYCTQEVLYSGNLLLATGDHGLKNWILYRGALLDPRRRSGAVRISRRASFRY
jgi:hypothetical protein